MPKTATLTVHFDAREPGWLESSTVDPYVDEEGRTITKHTWFGEATLLALAGLTPADVDGKDVRITIEVPDLASFPR